MTRSLEIRIVEPGLVVRTYEGESCTVTDAEPVHHRNLIFVTHQTFDALWPLIEAALGLARAGDGNDRAKPATDTWGGNTAPAKWDGIGNYDSNRGGAGCRERADAIAAAINANDTPHKTPEAGDNDWRQAKRGQADLSGSR